LSYLFVLVFKKILSKAMSEIPLKKLRREVRERESKKKAETTRKKQMERERAYQVCLT